MSKKIEELVEELIDDTKWAELYPNERSRRERNKTRDELLAEISKMDAVIEAAKKYINSDYKSDDEENYPEEAYQNMRATIRALEESEKEDER